MADASRVEHRIRGATIVVGTLGVAPHFVARTRTTAAGIGAHGTPLAMGVPTAPCDGAAIEDPHCQGTRQVLMAAGARLAFVPVDGDGLEVARLPAARMRLLCVTPSHQFPRGVVLSLWRRLELLVWANRADAWQALASLVESGRFERLLRRSGRPWPSADARCSKASRAMPRDWWRSRAPAQACTWRCGCRGIVPPMSRT